MITNKKDKVDTGLTLYEANKQIMEQTGQPISHLELAAIQAKLEDWFNW